MQYKIIHALIRDDKKKETPVILNLISSPNMYNSILSLCYC